MITINGRTEIWITLLTLAALVLSSAQAVAGLYIEPPGETSLRLGVSRSAADDPADTDQTFTETHQYFLEVRNRARRFVGVYIDREDQDGVVLPIDNGTNDFFINPLEDVANLDSIRTYFAWLFGEENDLMSKARNYVLPIPDDLEPGEEVQFRVSLVGPAYLKRLPYDVWGPEAPPQATRLLGATAYTMINVAIGPLIRKVLGGAYGIGSYDETAPLWETLAETIFLDLIAQLESSPDWINKLVQGEYSSFSQDYVKHLLNSDTLVTTLQSCAQGERSIDKVLAGLGNVIEAWGTVGDIANSAVVLEHLIDSEWEEQYVIRVVAPRIDAFVPGDGVAGDIIEIQGIGFAPYEGEGRLDPGTNQAMFSFRDFDNTVVPLGREAEILEESPHLATPASLYVRLPEDVSPGPVQVKVDMLTSNSLSFAADFPTTLQITDPEDGATLAGTLYDVTAVLADTPANFPSQPANARFYIDGDLVDTQSATQNELHFTLDMETLDPGSHQLTVSVEFFPYGNIASAGITITKPCSVSEPNDRWLMEWDHGCDGTIDSDGLWHLESDGTITDHWLGPIEGYPWSVQNSVITIGNTTDISYRQGTVADDCRTITDGVTLYTDGRDPSQWLYCWTARKY